MSNGFFEMEWIAGILQVFVVALILFTSFNSSDQREDEVNP